MGEVVQEKVIYSDFCPFCWYKQNCQENEESIFNKNKIEPCCFCKVMGFFNDEPAFFCQSAEEAVEIINSQRDFPFEY